jgi:hypothetical protein
MSVPKIPVMDFTEIEAVINFRKIKRTPISKDKISPMEDENTFITLHSEPTLSSRKKSKEKTKKDSPERARHHNQQRNGVIFD